MALSADDKAQIEVWVGTLSTEEDTAAGARLLVLGHALVVAYEILRVRHADAIGQPNEVRVEGDLRINWKGVADQIAVQMSALGEYICGLDPPLALNTEAKAVMATSSASIGARAMRARKYVSPNRRP